MERPERPRAPGEECTDGAGVADGAGDGSRVCVATEASEVTRGLNQSAGWRSASASSSSGNCAEKVRISGPWPAWPAWSAPDCCGAGGADWPRRPRAPPRGRLERRNSLDSSDCFSAGREDECERETGQREALWVVVWWRLTRGLTGLQVYSE